MADTPSIDELIDFPTVFVFRAMGDADDGFPDRCVAAVHEALGRAPEGVETRASRQARFLAVRVGAVVISTDEIYAVYAALRAVEGVRLVL